MSKYVLVTNYDDWEGLYLNGILQLEGHTVRREDLMELIINTNKKVTDFEEVDAYGWLYDGGTLPRTLTEVYQKNEEYQNESDI